MKDISKQLADQISQAEKHPVLWVEYIKEILMELERQILADDPDRVDMVDDMLDWLRSELNVRLELGEWGK